MLFERSLYYLLRGISVIKRKPEKLIFSENPWHYSRTVKVLQVQNLTWLVFYGIWPWYSVAQLSFSDQIVSGIRPSIFSTSSEPLHTQPSNLQPLFPLVSWRSVVSFWNMAVLADIIFYYFSGIWSLQTCQKCSTRGPQEVVVFQSDSKSNMPTQAFDCTLEVNVWLHVLTIDVYAVKIWYIFRGV